MATRGGRRPRFEPRSRHEDAAGHSALTLRKVRAVFELRHEEAAAHSTLALNKSVDVHTLDDHPGGWHTKRAGRRAYFGKSPRNLMSGSEPVWAGDSDSMRGADHSTPDDKGCYPPTCMCCDSRRVPTTTRIQSEAQDRVTGSFSNGRVPYTGLDTTA